MIELKDGTIRVSASTGVKTNVDYQSHDAHAGISVEVPIPDDLSHEELVAQAENLYIMLKSSTNALVAEEQQLPLDDEGRVIVHPATQTTSTPAPQVTSTPAPQPTGRAGGGQAQRITTVNGEEFYDNRPKKLTEEHKPTAADFRSVQGRRSVWVLDKQGNPKSDVVAEFGLTDAEVAELQALL